MKDYGFSRYFNPEKSFSITSSGIHEKETMKKRGTLVWNSARKGTYVRKIHGELK